MKNIFWISIMTLVLSCQSKQQYTGSPDQWKQEIVDTEAAFAKMVAEKGLSEGFLQYAAETAVIKREEDLFIGKEAIRKMFESRPTGTEIQLEWTPEFVDVAASGDLGYTYGYYTLTVPGPDTTRQSRGIFHTVWKRQEDGSWKYVWD